MRIVHVCEAVLPSRTASSLQVMRMAAAFAALGHEVIVLAPRRSDAREPQVDDLFGFYAVERTFRVEQLAWPRLPFRAVLFALDVHRRVRALAPDLVYSRSLHGGLLPARSGRHVVLEAHAPVWEYSRAVDAAIGRAAKKGILRELVVVTRSLQQAYVARGRFREDQVLVAPNGAPPPKPADGAAATAAHAWPGRAAALQVGYAGQLYPGKGMEIVAALAPRMPEVEFHVLGGMEDDLARWKQVAASPNLHWHGFVPQRELSSRLARLDVALLPVQRHAQGYDRGRPLDIAAFTSPIKLFDYLAHGKAVVASDLPVLREVIDEECARLVAPDDVAAWSAALRELADPARREALARAARRRWEERFTLEARARRILQFAGSEK